MAKQILYFLFFIAGSAFALDIVYVGDSHSSAPGSLFSQLKSTFIKRGGLRSGRAVCGARIGDFLVAGGVPGGCTYRGVTFLDIQNGREIFVAGPGKTEPIRDLMAEAKVVVIQLGDNHIDNPSEAGSLAKELAQTILLAGRKCVWIGPASMSASSDKTAGKCVEARNKNKTVSESIKRALGATSPHGKKCRFIDSFVLTDQAAPKSADCAHFKDYSVWANAIRADVDRSLQ